MEETKVFISWSGDRAKEVARVWRALLTAMFDAVEPFMSEEDIGAGDRNLRKIADELAGTNFGIVVVTPENQNSRWLNYEAGALSKNVEGDLAARVVPSLVDFKRAGDVERPLGQFQGKLLNQNGIRDILVAIAKAAGAQERRISSISERFESMWETDYEQRFADAARVVDKAPEPRKVEDMVDEILTIVRTTSPSDALAETLTLVRDMHKVAKFGQAPMERDLRLPIDLPLDEIRATVDSILGEGHGVPITLSCDDNCELVVQLHLYAFTGEEETKIFPHFNQLTQALLAVEGVKSISVPADADPHMPPVYRPWADAVRSRIAAARATQELKS